MARQDIGQLGSGVGSRGAPLDPTADAILLVALAFASSDAAVPTAVISASTTRPRTVVSTPRPTPLASRDRLLDMAVAWHRSSGLPWFAPRPCCEPVSLGGDSGLAAHLLDSLPTTVPVPDLQPQGTSRGHGSSQPVVDRDQAPWTRHASAENLELTKLLGWTHLPPLITPLPPPTCPPTLLACLLPRPTCEARPRLPQPA